MTFKERLKAGLAQASALRERSRQRLAAFKQRRQAAYLQRQSAKQERLIQKKKTFQLKAKARAEKNQYRLAKLQRRAELEEAKARTATARAERVQAQGGPFLDRAVGRISQLQAGLATIQEQATRSAEARAERRRIREDAEQRRQERAQRVSNFQPKFKGIQGIFEKQPSKPSALAESGDEIDGIEIAFGKGIDNDVQDILFGGKKGR